MTRVMPLAVVFVFAILAVVRGDLTAVPRPAPNSSLSSPDGSSFSSPPTSACGHDSSRPLVNSSGVITDSSGHGGLYLPDTNCVWVIAPTTRGEESSTNSPSPSPEGITLVFEKFATVLGDDFLFITDASANSDDVPLAAYTGSLPVPFAVRFNVTNLRLNFVTTANNQDKGFRLRYDTAPCFGGECGGRGACDPETGLCLCNVGWTGPECEVPLPSLATNGTKISDVASVGETKWFKIQIPPLDGSSKNVKDVVVLLSFPNGATGAKPLLTVVDASGGVFPSNSLVSPTHYDHYATSTNGSCGAFGELCGWRVGDSTKKGNSPALDVSSQIAVAGPSAAYRLGGEAFLNTPTPFGLRDVLLPALPTRDYYHRKALAAWSLNEIDTHELKLVGTDDASGPSNTDAWTSRASLPVGGSMWIVGVTNTDEKPLSDSLAGTQQPTGDNWWGPKPGFEGAERAVSFSIEARAITTPQDLCDANTCAAANGACDVSGTCRCRRPSNNDATAADASPAAATSTPATPSYGFQVGKKCVAPTAPDLLNGVASIPFSLRVGGWAYARVLVPFTNANDELVLELSHPLSPEASLAMFVGTEFGGTAGENNSDDNSRSVPQLNTECWAFGEAFGAGPFGDERCVATDVVNTVFMAGSRDALRVLSPSSKRRRNAVDDTLTTVLDVQYDYARIVIPPEAHAEFLQNSTSSFFWYVVAVWNPPSASLDDAREVRLRATFVPTQTTESTGGANEPVPVSRCPFDCSGIGACSDGAETLAATIDVDSPTLDQTPIPIVTVTADVPEFRNLQQSSCECPANTTGAYCQSPLMTLALNGGQVHGRLATGGWHVYELDVPGSFSDDATETSKNDAPGWGVLLELKRSSTSPNSFPMVFVKRGMPPAAFQAVFSPETQKAVLTFDAANNGRSVSGLGTPGNSVTHVDLPPGARVIGMSYDLTLTAYAPSFASEACFAFETNSGYEAAVCLGNAKAAGVFSLKGNTVSDDSKDAPTVAFDVPSIVSQTTSMDMETNYSNDSSDTVSDTSSKKSFKSGVTVELFEGYDDAIWGDGGRARAVTRNRNASKNSPDATWSGTVTLLYHQMLGTGFDHRDTSNSLCTGKDCAVGDDHEVFFPLDEFEDDESNDSSKNETTPSSNPSSGKQPAKIFIGVYNSRAVAQPGWLGGTLSRHESLRFQSPLEYVLTATAGSKATPVCFQNCSGRGVCSPEIAPVCDCGGAYFGPGCGIDPQQLPLNTKSPEFSLEEGHFVYFKLAVPVTEKSLTVTLTHNAHAPAFPRFFLKRDTVPVFCRSSAGAASGCVDDFDGSGFGNGTIVWESMKDDKLKGVSVLIATVDPRSRNGVGIGDPGRETADADALAFALNAARREGSFSGDSSESTYDSSDTKEDTAEDWTRIVIPPDGTVNPTSEVSVWYLAVYNDPFEGRGALAFSVAAKTSGEAFCPSLTCGGEENRGECDTSTGQCVCAPGFFGATCAARLTELSTDTDERVSVENTGLEPGEFTFFSFEVKCKGQDVLLTLMKTTPNDSAPAPSLYQLMFAVRRGEAPVIDTGEYLAGALLSPSDNDDESAEIEIKNADPGTYFAVVRVDRGYDFFKTVTATTEDEKIDTSTSFAVSLQVTGSRAPNEFNECTHANGRLVVTVTSDEVRSDDGNDDTEVRSDDDTNSNSDSFELLGPDLSEFDDSNSDGAPLPFSGFSIDAADAFADVYEPNYGLCGVSLEKTCYLGDEHSSFRVDGLPSSAKGHGEVTGQLVLSKSKPQKNDQAFRYDWGDVRKKNVFDDEGMDLNDSIDSNDTTSNETQTASGIYHLGVPNSNINFDLEACGSLVNPEEVKGKVCVAVRGSCFFSTKTLMCQAAGAVAVVLVNSDFTEGASDFWVTSHPPNTITIPTLSVSGVTGNRLLRSMMRLENVSLDQNGGVSKPSYGGNVTLTASAYRCLPSVFCPACADGVSGANNNCTGPRCPGMNQAFTQNCTGHGVGAHGGCEPSLGDEGSDLQFTCTCAEGYGGDACATRETTSAYETALRFAEAERAEQTRIAEASPAMSPGSAYDALRAEAERNSNGEEMIFDEREEGSSVATSSTPVALQKEQERGMRNVSLVITGFVILTVALVLASVATLLAKRRVKNARVRQDVERHIEETGGI